MNKPLRTLLASALALLAIQFACPHATAQFGGDRIKRPLNRPTVSPYLNLFRRGNGRSPILNYYGAVRPQQQSFQQDQQLSKGLERVEDRNRNSRNRYSNKQSGNDSFRRYRMSITGHRAGFMTIGGGGSGGDEGGGGGGSFGQGDDEESSGNRFSGHSASFGRGSIGSPQQ